MRVLVIQHPDGGTPGVFADEAAARGAALVPWTPGNGEPAPAGGAEAFDAVVVLGGAENPDELGRFPYLAEEVDVLRGALAREQPVLGVCLGHQLLAVAAGLPVRPAPHLEFGLHPVRRTPAGAADPLLSALPETFDAYCWHSYEVAAPDGASLATSAVCAQALRYGAAAWGVQFHPEVDPSVLDAWYADWEANRELVAAGCDRADALRLAHGPELATWMALGRRLFGRFAELAAAAR